MRHGRRGSLQTQSQDTQCQESCYGPQLSIALAVSLRDFSWRQIESQTAAKHYVELQLGAIAPGRKETTSLGQPGLQITLQKYIQILVM